MSPCPTRSGSTFLYNAICGLVNPELPSIVTDKPDKVVKIAKNYDVIKSHNLNIGRWDSVLRKHNIEPYFISSERPAINRRLTNKSFKNHLVFQYDELLETDTRSLETIVDHIYEKMRKFLPDYIEMDKDDCLKRLTNMNILVKEIANKPFAYVDPFYQIHGGHRNRSN